MDALTVSSIIPELLAPISTAVANGKATPNQTYTNSDCSGTVGPVVCNAINRHAVYTAHAPFNAHAAAMETNNELDLTLSEPINPLDELSALLEDNAMEMC